MNKALKHVLNFRYVVKCHWIYLCCSLRMDEKLICSCIHLLCGSKRGREGKGMPGIRKTERTKEHLKIWSIPEVPVNYPCQYCSAKIWLLTREIPYYWRHASEPCLWFLGWRCLHFHTVDFTNPIYLTTLQKFL